MRRSPVLLVVLAALAGGAVTAIGGARAQVLEQRTGVRVIGQGGVPFS
jgi:hypothetical protein